MSDYSDFFGGVIHQYSRRQALEDGVLVDMNAVLPVDESPYIYPVACTQYVWGIIERASEYTEPKYLVWDILMMSTRAVTEDRGNERIFDVMMHEPGLPLAACIHRLKIHLGPDDDGYPVLTVMREDED